MSASKDHQEPPGDPLTISQVAQETGLAVSALRYYDDLGLVPSTGRTSRVRTYGSEAVTRARVVIAAQRTGFTLAEIGELLDRHQTDRSRWRSAVGQKAAEQRATADRHLRMARLLEHSLECRAVEPLRCPEFLEGVRSVWDPDAQRGVDAGRA